jgi:hypothetical protein
VSRSLEVGKPSQLLPKRRRRRRRLNQAVVKFLDLVTRRFKMTMPTKFWWSLLRTRSLLRWLVSYDFLDVEEHIFLCFSEPAIWFVIEAC